MAYILLSIYNTYKYFFTEYEDPRVKDYFGVGVSLPPVLAVIIFYLYLVTKWGPAWMENRKPFKIRNWLIAYNIVQIVLNITILSIGLKNSYLHSEFSFVCQPIDTTNNEPYMKNLIFASYIYYLSKYLDLFDTIFFVLRKKNSHVTFLHVYHHSGMIFAVYIFMKFLVGSHATLLGVINSFVHIIMYLYYLLTSFNKNLKKSIWWKRYITQMQLAQFAYLVFHFFLPFIVPNCGFAKLISFVGFSQNLFMFMLFSDFYYKAYIRKKEIV